MTISISGRYHKQYTNLIRITELCLVTIIAAELASNVSNILLAG